MEESTLIWLSYSLFYITSFFVLFIISKQFFALRFKTIDINKELTSKDNIAFSILTTGYFTGILIIFIGLIQGETKGIWEETFVILGYGILGNLLLIISSLLNEKLVFVKKVKLYKEIIKDENIGTGCIEAANFIGSSLIIYGAINGKSINIFPSLGVLGLHLSGVLSLLFFWSLGQLALVLFLSGYAATSRYKILEQIEKDNNAVGIIYASTYIALSYLYQHAIAGDFISWVIIVENLFYHFGFAIAILPVARWLVDKIILPQSNLTDEIINQDIPNQGAAFIEAFAYIGSAILISYCI